MTSPLYYQSQPTRQALFTDGRYRERDPSVKVCTKIKLDCAYEIQEPLAFSSDVSFWYKELLPTAWYSDFQKLLSIRQFRRNGWRKREFRPMICVASNLPTIRRSFGELIEHLFVKIKDHFPLKQKTGFFSSTALRFPYNSLFLGGWCSIGQLHQGLRLLRKK